MQLITDALDSHARALEFKGKRLEVLAENIANADTPHFKARDIDFRKVLAQAASEPMTATQSLHYARGDAGTQDGLMYRVPLNAAFDGNTVELSIEQANFGKAAANYQATLNFLENRIGGIRKALRGE